MKFSERGSKHLDLSFEEKTNPFPGSYYNRHYQVDEVDAMGVAGHRRGFHDPYMWTASTTQEKVSAVIYQDDVPIDPSCTAALATCETRKAEGVSKMSYAIPLEMIYLTPLGKWNPYNITRRDKEADVIKGQLVDPEDPDGGRLPQRTGNCAAGPTMAYDGYSVKSYAFFTPASFYEATGNSVSAADTSGASVCALGADGESYTVRASGSWITLPKIDGVGKLRTRFMISPVHQFGNPIYKEMKALQELALAKDYESPDKLDGFFGEGRDLKYPYTVMLEGGGH